MNLTHGEVSRPNPCKLCTCENGVGVCNLQKDCPVLDCEPSMYLQEEGECCPVCKGRKENAVLFVKVGRRMLSCL